MADHDVIVGDGTGKMPSGTQVASLSSHATKAPSPGDPPIARDRLLAAPSGATAGRLDGRPERVGGGHALGGAVAAASPIPVSCAPGFAR